MIRRRPLIASSLRKRDSRRLFLEGLEDRALLATLVSDLPDYSPGATAYLTASGYQVGEAVKFQVLHNDGTPNTGGGHEPWTVTDGSAADLDGLTNGDVKTSWYVNPDDSYRSSFEASALGLSSNLYATTTFTDEKVVDFRQAANDANEPGGVGDIDWTSSILQQQNSVYFEGMSVMQRIYFTGFPDNGNDQIATLNFTLQFTKGGTHAYDWLTSWDQAISAAAAAGVPFDNIQVDPNQNTLHAGTENNLTLAEAADEAIGPPDTVDDDIIELRSPGTDGQVFYVDVVVPDDPFISKDGAIQPRINAYESVFGNRTIRVYANQAIDPNPANTFLTLSHSVANGGDTGDSDVTYTLTIKFLGTAGEATMVHIEAAGHLAKTNGPDGWGAGLGSSQINGGPYHFTLGAADGTSIGNQDNQIKGADIEVPPGSIAWEKRRTDADPVLLGGATFTITPNPLTGSGSLVVLDNGPNDADPDPGQFLVLNALAGSYTVTETTPPAGFAVDDDPTRAVTVAAGEAAVIGSILGAPPGTDDPGNTDESDFHNRLGSVAWEKRTDVTPFPLQGGATFEINFDDASGFATITVVDNGLNDADPVAGQILVNNVPLGTHVITETIAPAGWALDDDATRSVTVTSGALTQVIGTQGQDDAGNTDESDFHNRLGSVAWEKRTDVTPFPLQGGATFELNFDDASGFATITVVDNGLNDANPTAGQILVNNVPLGTHVITETIAPAGYALDDDATRSVTVTSGALTQVIGTQGQDDPGNTDESDFHNRLGSVAWEKRTDVSPFPLQGGATFELNFDDASGFATITVVDNGLNDADPVAGQILVNNVPLGTHVITETIAPAGYALDDDATRSVTVTSGALAQVIGTQGQDDPGNTDESDFHNRLGSVAWEKRTDVSPFPLQGGATFEINFDDASGFATITVVDNGLNDADPVAGQILVNNVPLGTHVITETIAPAGWALDDDATRSVTVTSGALAQVIGTQGQDDPGNTDESDFHNRQGSIAWEKRTDVSPFPLQGGATFELNFDDATGLATITVVDNGLNDADPVAGQILVNNVPLGTHVITETIAPAGYALDDDATRSVTVTSGALAQVIGTQGQDDAGNTDESDFHNRLGSVAWEKRTDVSPFPLQGGATFEINFDDASGFATITVVDNGLNDADPVAGQILVNNVPLGTHVITETIAPAGYALDDDATRSVTVTSGALTQVIGTQGQDDAGNSDESDFHNRLGSVAWEKRTDVSPFPLQGGATFELNFDDASGFATIIVVDNGLNDVDPVAGQILVSNVPLGTHVITETAAPAGFGLDDDVTRSVTVTSGALAQVIGIQGQDDPGNTDESDFHNPLGSIAWEKRTDVSPFPLQGGATFELNFDDATGLATITVVDNGLNDADPVAGQILVSNVPLGTHVITETIAPAGYALDDDATRSVTVTSLALNQVIGIQGQDDPGNTDESDFHNRLGSVAWEKRTDVAPFPLQGGATFEVNFDDASGFATITVVDNGLNDADPVAGQILVINVPLGTHVITETIAPPAFSLDNDPTRQVTVSAGDLNPVVGTQGIDDPGDTDESDFHNPIGRIVIGPDKTNASLPYIHVVNAVTGEVIARFLAYDESYRGGVRVATGDLTGDGVAEIITAPGRGHSPLIKIWDQDGNPLGSFLAFSSSFVGGVDIAVGDVTGDGWNDIVAAQNYNGNLVTVFRNLQTAPNPTFATFGSSFSPFGASYKGGATVEVANMGTPTASNQLNTDLSDGKAELIIGSETGIAPVVQVRGYFGAATTPTVMRTFNPFSPGMQGGMSLDVYPVDLGDMVPDIIVGAGNLGGSQVQILNGVTGAVIIGFPAFTDPAHSPFAPIDVAAVDEDGNGRAEALLVCQGSDGTANEIRKFDALTGTLISALPESAFDSVFNGNPINDYAGAYFVATLVDTGLPEVEVQFASTGLTTSLLPYGPTYFGGVSVATGDLNGDGVEEIVTGPERNYAPWVRIFDQNGNMLHQFLAYSSSFKGGVDVAVGDINGDGKLDIATSMLSGGSQVKTFKNVVVPGSITFPKTSFGAHSNFYPFGSSFKGGAVVEVADMGKPVTVSGKKVLDSTQLDGKSEVVVANGPGMRSTVKAYGYYGTSTTATALRSFFPLNATFKGGLSLDLGDVNDDQVPDVIVGAGSGGGSQVQVLNGATGAVMSSFQAFQPSEFNYNAKLDVEAQDVDLDGVIDFLLAAHDFDGKSREVRRFNALTGDLVDAFFQDYSKI